MFPENYRKSFLTGYPEFEGSVSLKKNKKTKTVIWWHSSGEDYRILYASLGLKNNNHFNHTCFHGGPGKN